MEDRNDFPLVVTLAFEDEGSQTDILTASFHAKSEEGRYRVTDMLVQLIYRLGEHTSETPPVVSVDGEPYMVGGEVVQ